MALRGRIQTSFDTGASHVLVGDALVPGRLTMTMTGELGDPDAVVQFEVRNGRPECVEFTVRAGEKGRGIRSSDLTFLNIDSLVEAAFLEWATPEDGGPLGGADDDERRQLRKELEGAIHAPGRGASQAELEEVARIYRKHPSAPTSAVEKLLGYTRRTASRRVQQARDAGLL